MNNQFEPLGGYQGDSQDFSPQDMAQQSQQGYVPQQEGAVSAEQSGHKLSHVKIGLIVFGIIIVLILGLTIFSRIKLSKQPSQNQPQVSQQEKRADSQTKEDAAQELVTQAESMKNKGETGRSDSGSEESSETDKSSVNEENVGSLEIKEEEPVAPAEQGEMSELSQDPQLSEEKQASVIVSKKNIYQVDETAYAYSLTLLMLADGQEDDYVTIKYFCSRRTFDNVEKGDNLTMTYQVDSNGVVSPAGIAR